ncbi:olfactory receptor 5M11-like [Discoglossus pictus]
MDQTNQTMVTYFIILGISDVPQLQIPIVLLVLLIYLFTLGGNMAILILVCLDPQLHTPMYFFLGNLSIMDISITTVILPKALVVFISGDMTITFFACMTQMFIFLSLTCDELLILTAMSYDRYVAICNPLRYHMFMNRRVCALLATVSWMLGFTDLIPTMWTILGFTCYRSNIINHFFCDIVPLKKLFCDDTSVLEMYTLLEGGIIAVFTPFLLTFISYIFIITTILRIPSSIGRHKAFYTCSSHITVVILLYVILFSQYLTPTSMGTVESKKLFSLFNTAAVPILNPLIYSLKNKDVKAALRRQLRYFKVAT